MKKVIILLGVPGSGKGTQAKFLCEKFGYGHISTGNLLRALEADAAAPQEQKEKLAAMKAGKLVADDVIYTLAFAEMRKFLSQGMGVVLDGAIRSVDQAKAYQDFFEHEKVGGQVIAIEIALSDDEIIKRLETRRNSGEVRADDNPEIMKQRIRDQGNTALGPIVQYYRDKGILVHVDGNQSIHEVAEAIEHVLH